MKLSILTFLALFTLLFFLSLAAWGQDGLRAQVIVLQTPMFKGPDINSKILHYLRKGEIIKLHDKHKGVGPADVDYGIINPDDHPLFYSFISSTGNDVYVLREHVKVIFNDFREMDYPITPYQGHDPTDYRMLEPLPPGYPIADPRANRILYLLGAGPGDKNRYPYKGYLTHEDYLTTWRGQIAYTQTVDLIDSSRMMFGGIVSCNYKRGDFSFAQNQKAYERSLGLGIGPYVSYDGFRNENYAIIFAGSIGVNGELNSISLLEDAKNVPVIRQFWGYYFNSQVSAAFVKKLNSIASGFDFVVKGELGLESAHTLLPLDKLTTSDEIWNNGTDGINSPFAGNLSLYVGFQYTRY
ncbi:MAG: hypothetical protein A2504_02050 [Bdellovibrionales bacterium RIFOXYD12_FULL_39_22]|nr:MAG: hypothetical protein A2385_12075 [Bdellovibrionales bacterium RIFOXYB1_FULL_39_21]OFZ41380.1 MAG: hypothetical protein A2485_01245 [Bdellovibrionales bacterium RIFOXYC12_FULL_39_17]OFZ45335.1 MAG: hypothetical protein A2404_13260 [Bdellovibrionales bacterium RIFOXYC1_FULL_39_130]OFZ69364.1 MAG: hypothetical protein A2451_06610 [Bdellovibrionales bacterium RIFOXYC2_FULL_39_8]OFZ74531.1 MAG: hypothetical protein A2560_12365 [Bdellovibrionales bacterium RIFOXYD1_FULL_39_84]OFZ92540.1 MAG: